MPYPDTNTVTPLFIEDQPDWSKDMSLVSTWSTSQAEAEAGGEQRANWRKRPRYAFAFIISALTTAEFSKRRAKQIGELAAPVVVPIWTDEILLSSMTGVNQANFASNILKKKFKVGSYAYFVQGVTTYFRKITAVNSTSLTLLADGGAPAFTAGASVYPCIVGLRQPNTSSFEFQKVDQTDEVIAVEEL